MNLQNSIIRRHWLKGNVCMPSIAGEFAWLSQRIDNGSAFLLLHAADDADLVSEFAASLRDRMDMKP